MSAAPRRLLFDDFELRLDSGELLRAGAPVKLQPQPARILEILASRSGEVVSREEIRQLVWSDAFVDSDASLNFSVKEIRRALGDSAATPSFVETIPRRGYRFLKPVEVEPETGEPATEPLHPSSPSPPPSPASRRWPRLGTVGALLALLVLLTLLIGSRLHTVAHPRPAPPRQRPAAGARASSPADDAYLRGIYLQRHEHSEEAETALEEATLLDPGFAPAYAELALVRLHIPAMMATSSSVEVTEAAARHALALDPDLANAHLALGQILLNHSRDWAGAGRELQRALELDPDNAEAHHVNSLYLAALGRHAEARAAAERARRLDPASMLVGSDYAWLFYLDHHYEEAIREARKILEIFPLGAGAAPQEARSGKSLCESTILYSAWKLGDQETALGAAKAILEIMKLPAAAAGLRGVEAFWRGQERFFENQSRQRPVDPFELARNAMILGRRDRALDLLTRQCMPQGIGSPFAAVDPIFDDLHDDPRWSQVLDCLKLPANAPARR
jgi:DNA-binding winged helix-turn-helix (wHTH) protein/tetratricopeptide (TPR) repeat protein